jgi:hypothetical protein
MKNRVQLICLLLTLAIPATAEIPTIHCPAEPPVVRRLQLQEQWRIDAEDPEAPLMGFFDQAQIVVHDGRVYMLDRQLCHVLVYGDDGEYLDTIVREGDGPGEVRNPGVMFLCDDGRLAVQHGYPTKLEFVDLDGTPRGSWRVEAFTWINQIRETSRGWFAVYTETKESEEPGTYVSAFHAAYHDEEGRRTDEFHSEEEQKSFRPSGRTDEADEYQPWYSAVAIGDGQVVLSAARDEYRLEWRNIQGEVTRVATREFTAHSRSDAELDEIKYQSYTISEGKISFADRKLCARDPMIRTIEPLPDGTLRVRTSLFEKDLPEGMVCRYEVHEATGHLRERVEIYDPTGDYDRDYDVIALLEDGRAMVLRNLRPAIRVAIDANLHPGQRDKLPPIPDDREDVAFTPIMCELVPWSEPTER